MPRSADEARSHRIRSDVMEVLRTTGYPLSKKKIRSNVAKLRREGSDSDNTSSSGRSAVTASELKKALKKLVRAGGVEQRHQDGTEGEVLFCPSDSPSGGRAASEVGVHTVEQFDPTRRAAHDGGDGKAEDEDNEVVPFAEMMRRRRQAATLFPRCGAPLSSRSDASEKTKRSDMKEDDEGDEDINVDIDEEIRQLEAELAGDNSEDSASDTDDDPSRDDGAKGTCRSISFGQTTTITTINIDNEGDGRGVSRSSDQEGDSAGIICLSEAAKDKIAPLPPSALPQNKRRKLNGIDGEEPNKQKQRRREGGQLDVSDGLQQAVKEVLDGYVARSNQRLPFYCRVCSIQSEDEKSFLAHKATEFHKAAVQAERKATYCQACRKQFTSPVQMKEHLKSRPHREKMDYLKARQRGEVVGCGGPGGRGSGDGNKGGRGGRYISMGRGSHGPGLDAGRSRRQWC